MGCPMLLLLNDTAGLALVSASLASFNNKTGNESLFVLEEVGRMTSKVKPFSCFYIQGCDVKLS